jgi:dihydrodipicolinate synthase/N-acetylneuraminate lyase
MTDNIHPKILLDKLKEVHVYITTPFTDNLLKINESGFQKNLDELVKRGVKICAVGGGTGEADALSHEEQLRIAQLALEAVGDRALVVATLPGNLGEAVPLARKYHAMGIEVALALPPLIRGRTVMDAPGIVQYFKVLTNSTDLPIMPYNNQAWPLDFYLGLADNPRIIAIKDAMLDPLQIFRAIQRLGKRFPWIGNKSFDPPVTHLRYRAGMECFTSGMANFYPEPELALHEACKKGDIDEALRLQKICAGFSQLRSAADDASAVKAAMDIVGFSGGKVRPPRLNVDERTRSEIATILKEALAGNPAIVDTK